MGRMKRRDCVAVVMGVRVDRRWSTHRRFTDWRLRPSGTRVPGVSPGSVVSAADRSGGGRAVGRRRSRGLSLLCGRLSSGPSGGPLLYSRLRRCASECVSAPGTNNH